MRRKALRSLAWLRSAMPPSKLDFQNLQYCSCVQKVLSFEVVLSHSAAIKKKDQTSLFTTTTATTTTTTADQL
jgi:hypothetical protein